MASVLFWAVIHCIAFFVGGPVGTLAALALWVVASYLPGKKAQEREEARVFSWSEQPAGDVYVSTRIDFEEMTMRSHVDTPGTEREEEVHLLRRGGDGWQMKMDDATRDAVLKKGKRNPFYDDERKAADYRNDWQPFDGHTSSKIEVAYQRYLKTL